MAEVSDTMSYQWPKWPWKKVDAIDDTATANEDSPVTINVLGNDKNYTGIYKIFDDNKISDVPLTDSALTDSLVAAEDYTTSLYPKPYTITLDSGAKVELLQDGTVKYDPNGQFNDLKAGETALDSFGYAAYGRYGADTAKVTVTITGLADDEPPTGNQAPVAEDDTAYVYKTTLIQSLILIRCPRRRPRPPRGKRQRSKPICRTTSSIQLLHSARKAILGFRSISTCCGTTATRTGTR